MAKSRNREEKGLVYKDSNSDWSLLEIAAVGAVLYMIYNYSQTGVFGFTTLPNLVNTLDNTQNP